MDKMKMEVIKVLVVDDEPEYREALIAGLLKYGFRKEHVVGGETGEEAVRLVGERPEFFDVAVVDHILKKDKELDGISATRRIRELSRKIFPIIFTNMPTDNPKTIAKLRIDAYEAGAYRYMDRSGSREVVSKVKDFISEIMQLSQLRERVRKYYDAQDNVPSLLTQLDIMVALIDRGYKVWYMNEANRKFQGLSELPLKPCSAAFCGFRTVCPCFGCIVARTLEDGKPRERIYLRSAGGAGGRLKWINMWTQPMANDKGEPLLLDDDKPIAVLESSQDLTDSVRLKSMPMEERLAIIAQALNEREDGFDRVRIYRADPQGKTLNITACVGYPRKIQPALITINEFPNIQRSIRYFKQNHIGLFHDKSGHPDSIFPDEPLEKFIQWPLMKGNRLLGLLSVSGTQKGRPCTEDGIDILADYAQEALKAFEAVKESPKALEFEEKIFAIDNMLIQKRTPEDTLQTLVDEVYRLTGSDNVYIRYRDEKESKGRLLSIGKGPYMETAPSEIPFSDRIVPSVQVLMTGQELIKKNAQNDPEVRAFMEKLPKSARKSLENMGAYCIEPLIFQNRCIGSLSLTKSGEKHYRLEEIGFAREIAERMSLAVRDYLVNIDRMRKDYAFESSINAVVFANLNDNLDYMNQSFLTLWGYKCEEDALGQPFLDLWQNKKLAARILRMLHEGESWFGELVALKKDGASFDAQLSANPLKDKTGKIIGTMATFIDITERKRLEKVRESIYRISEEASSARNLDELYKKIHDIVKRLMPADNFYIALYDKKYEIVSFPYFVDELGASVHQLDFTFEPRKSSRGMTEYVLRTELPLLAPRELIMKLHEEGEVDIIGPLPIDWVGIPLKTVDDEIIGVLAVQIYKKGVRYTEDDKDMLEFVSTQIAMAIERTMEEQKKEIMLQEIHHRVKNTFNFISSLVDLQSRQIKDQQVKEQFRNTQERIMLMAMVHDKLYQSGNLSEIDFTRYVGDLVGSLQRLHAIEGEMVSIDLKVDPISMGIDKAIPCGLIINELLTNALKYAFPGERRKLGTGENNITIELVSKGKGKVMLAVKDNGIGLPPEVNFYETPSLGLRLIRLLSMQIHGSIDLDQTKGTTVEITFDV